MTDILKKLAEKKKGTFFRVVYKTNPTLNKEAKKSGVEITKIVEKTVRSGINYSGTKSAKIKAKCREEKETSEQRKITKWWHYVIANYIAEHNTNGTQYAVFFPTLKGTNTKSTYFLNGEEVPYEKVIPFLSTTSDADEPLKDAPLTDEDKYSKLHDFLLVKAENIIEIR